VGGFFRPDGLFLTVIEDGKTYQRLIPWKELYRMAKRGEKMTAHGMLKKVTDQVSRAVKSNQAFTAASEKRLDELKKVNQERPLLPPKVAL
jgi:hypothetical protein